MNDLSLTPAEALFGACSAIRPLPSVVRYVDDFSDKAHAITDLSQNSWEVWSSGSKLLIKFERYTVDVTLLLIVKGWMADALVRGRQQAH